MSDSSGGPEACDKRIHITIKDKRIRDSLALIPKANRGAFVERALRLFLSTQDGESIFEFLRMDRPGGDSPAPPPVERFVAQVEAPAKADVVRSVAPVPSRAGVQAQDAATSTRPLFSSSPALDGPPDGAGDDVMGDFEKW